jgi:type I restriction enzyme S subunit
MSGEQVKSGYKRTQVGVIPDEWNIDRLEKFWSVTDCKHVTAKFVASGYPVASIKEVQSRFVELAEAKQTTTHFYQLLTEGGRKPKAGDLIISRNATVGEVAQVADWHPPFAMGQDVCLMRKCNEDYSTDFLQSLFQSPIIARQLSDLMVGSTFKRINVQQIKNFSIPIPSPSEQRAISTALSDVDTLLASFDRHIAKKRDLKQAAMQQLLTGQTRLPGFSGEWEIYSVEELEKQKLVKLSRGMVISKKDIASMAGDFPIYSSSIHNDGLFGRYGDFMFDEELITWSVDGGGNFFHRPKHKFSVTNVCGYMRVDTSRIFYRYFAAHLQQLHSSKSFDYQIKAHPSVIRKEYQVQLPSLEEQKAISEVLTEMDADLRELEQRRNKTAALKQGMMQELITGRKRLI